MANAMVIPTGLYCAWWLYALFTFEIPVLQCHLGSLLNLTAFQLIFAIVFIFPCTIPLIFIAAFVFFCALFD
jgi:hypothetical protein